MTDWPIVSVGDVSLLITKGTTPTTLGARFQDHGINFVKVESLASGRIDHGKLAYIDEETHLLLKRSVLQEHDVLFSIAGTIGRTARVEAPDLPANTNQAVAIIRPNPEIVDRDFLFYCLNDTNRIATARSRVVQSVQQNLSLAEVGNVEIPLPPIEEQRAIAATLGAIDGKIESNRRVQDTGQRILRAIVNSALDETEGDQGRLDDYCDLVKEGVSVDALDPEEHYIALEHMPRGSIWLADWSVADGLGSNKSRFREGDILFGKLRPYFKKVGVAPISGVCSTDVLVLRPRRTIDRALVAIVASSDALIDSLSASATGTKMPRASWRDLASWPVPILTAEEQRKLGETTLPLLERLAQLTLESRKLATLRDTLLPELLSGRMRVPEATEVVETAA